MFVTNVNVFYNIHLAKQTYFRCGIVKLMPQQDLILLEISTKVILRKLELSNRFPRNKFYSRNAALGVGLMIHVLALKLCV